MKVVSVGQMQAIERQSDSAGASYAQMMENAGRGTAEAIADTLPVDGLRVVILVGPGNNGGDGLVAGRYLAQCGAEVELYLCKPRTTDDINYAQVVAMGLPVANSESDPRGDALLRMVSSADIIVDALLGTGVDRPISGPLKLLLERTASALAESRKQRAQRGRRPVSPIEPAERSDGLPLVVAVDCPSGLNCDNGWLDPAALAAHLTVTFDSPKVGQFLFPGASAVGRLVVADIGSPCDLPLRSEVSLELATADRVRAVLPSRPADAHKGTFGKVMIAAGSVNYTGAAMLAAEAAYRTGAGLVTLAIPSAIHTAVAARLAEATYVLLPHDLGAINENAAKVLLDAIDGYDSLLIGPGLGRDEKTRVFLHSILTGGRTGARGRIGFVHGTGEMEQSGRAVLPPLVVDADGLNLLAGMERWPALLPAGSILTPHPGEMARLSGCSTGEVASDRIGTAEAAAERWGHVVVLKGAFTVVAGPDGRTTIIPVANAALATAGSGDVLAGAIAALLALGLPPYDAAVAGAFLHGAAGIRAAEEFGAAGVMAGDLPWLLAVVTSELS